MSLNPERNGGEGGGLVFLYSAFKLNNGASGVGKNRVKL